MARDSVVVVVVVVVMSAFWDSKTWLETLQVLDAVRAQKSKSVECVVLYAGFMRQDRVIHPGEPVLAEIAAQGLTRSADTVKVLDVHSPEAAKQFGKSFKSISSWSLFSQVVKEYPDALIVAPDEGVRARARAFAKDVGLSSRIGYIVKQRSKTGLPQVKKLVGNVKDRDVIFVDDIIDTGATIFAATQYVKSREANRVGAVITHGLFTGKALKALKRSSVERIYGNEFSETKKRTPSKVRVVSLQPLLKEILSK